MSYKYYMPLIGYLEITQEGSDVIIIDLASHIHVHCNSNMILIALAMNIFVFWASIEGKL
jgi:hypothetical protein